MCIHRPNSYDYFVNLYRFTLKCRIFFNILWIWVWRASLSIIRLFYFNLHYISDFQAPTAMVIDYKWVGRDGNQPQKFDLRGNYAEFLGIYFEYLNLKGSLRWITGAKFWFMRKCIIFLQFYFEYLNLVAGRDSNRPVKFDVCGNYEPSTTVADVLILRCSKTIVLPTQRPLI